MSSNSYTTICPVCQNDSLEVLESNRPYPTIDTWCRTCGFTTYTSKARESLEACNDNREEWWVEELLTQEQYDQYNDHPLFNDNL